MIVLRAFFFLILFCLPLFVSLNDSAVWDSNEAFYAQTPREMLERDEWVVPYFNGRPRLNKPPLAYWAVGLSYRLFAPTLFWERLTIALLAAGSLGAVFCSGVLLFGASAGLLATGILATSFRFLVLSRRSAIEILLLFCLLWALVCFLCWLRSGRRIWFLGCCLFFGLGFLTKGPVALLPALSLGLFMALQGRLLQLLRAPWILGGLLFAGVSASWFLLLGIRIGWGPVADFFLEENLSRFAAGGFGPERGPFYYLGVLLGDFFPWSLLLPAALIWFALGKEDRSQRSRWLLLALWMITILAFFSLSSSKQEYYILPLYPAAALLIARYLERSRPPFLLLLGMGVLVAALSLGLSAAALALFSENWLWLPLLVVPLVLLGLLFRRHHWAVAGLSLFYAAAFSLYLAPLEEFQPVPHLARALAEDVARQGENDYRAGYYRLASPSLVFYLDHPVEELYEPAPAAAWLDSGMPSYLIVGRDDLPALERAVGRRLQIVEEQPKLYTTARHLIQGLKRGRTHSLRESWTRPVYLVTSRGTR